MILFSRTNFSIFFWILWPWHPVLYLSKSHNDNCIYFL